MASVTLGRATWFLICEAMYAASTQYRELAACSTVDAETRREYAAKADACERIGSPLMFVDRFSVCEVDDKSEAAVIAGDLKFLEALAAGSGKAWASLMAKADLLAAEAPR